MAGTLFRVYHAVLPPACCPQPLDSAQLNSLGAQTGLTLNNEDGIPVVGGTEPSVRSRLLRGLGTVTIGPTCILDLSALLDAVDPQLKMPILHDMEGQARHFAFLVVSLGWQNGELTVETHFDPSAS